MPVDAKLLSTGGDRHSFAEGVGDIVATDANVDFVRNFHLEEAVAQSKRRARGLRRLRVPRHAPDDAGARDLDRPPVRQDQRDCIVVVARERPGGAGPVEQLDLHNPVLQPRENEVRRRFPGSRAVTSERRAGNSQTDGEAEERRGKKDRLHGGESCGMGRPPKDPSVHPRFMRASYRTYISAVPPWKHATEIPHFPA